MNSTTIQPYPRTTLVSIFGWVMLVVGILMTLVFILNLVLFSLVIKNESAELLPAEELAELPAFIPWVMEHMGLVLGVMIILSLVGAVAGFGIVKRHDWGRRLSIILLAASIVWALVGGAMGMKGLGNLPEYEGEIMGPVIIAINIGSVLLTVVLHGWLIWKLRTREIRGEFVESLSESF